MPFVSIEELRLAAQQQFLSQYQIVHEGAQKPFVAQLVPLGAAPPLYPQEASHCGPTPNPDERHKKSKTA